MGRVEARRRTFGQHFTSVETFTGFILPAIKDHLHEHTWVDMFCGEGNLILPLLELLPVNERARFFEEHVYLFDIQQQWVEKAISNAVALGIPEPLATSHIQQRDSIKDYPSFLLRARHPVYHVTNPPYLYIGYIVKTPEARRHLAYFTGKNEGYQDLCQLGMMNDLRHGIDKMIYIIPSNFLFGNSISNKIRDDFLAWYAVDKAIIFEKKIFEATGTNVAICFFSRKAREGKTPVSFTATKIGTETRERRYTLDPRFHYKAGTEFDVMMAGLEARTPLETSYYLMLKDVRANAGSHAVPVIDANAFEGGTYKALDIHVNDALKEKILGNILWVRTVDTGGMDGRAGLYTIRDSFHVDGILVTRNTYRTHPIQLFVSLARPREEHLLLRDYFNLLLEHLRGMTDSEFMTTYKYTGAGGYTRKYFGLSQARKILATYPGNDLDEAGMASLSRLVRAGDAAALVAFLQAVKDGTATGAATGTTRARDKKPAGAGKDLLGYFPEQAG